MSERIRTGSCGTNGSGSSSIDCTQYCDGYVPGTSKLNEIQCDLVSGAPIHQLTKFCEEQGIDKNIFPITLIQAVFDGRNGMRLDRVLAMCNNIYLQWKGTFGDTVNFVQGIYRRKGLIVNYRDELGAVSTIRYNSTDVSDEAWRNPDNWIGWSFDTCKDDLKEILDYIFNHLDNYPDIIRYLSEAILNSQILRDVLNELVLDNIDEIIQIALNNYFNTDKGKEVLKEAIRDLLDDLLPEYFEDIQQSLNDIERVWANQAARHEMEINEIRNQLNQYTSQI